MIIKRYTVVIYLISTGDRYRAVHLGESFVFICPESSHRGRSSVYHYNSSAEQYKLVLNDSHRYQTIIKSLDDAGEYCCTKHHGGTLMLNKSHSCVQIVGMYISNHACI